MEVRWRSTRRSRGEGKAKGSPGSAGWGAGDLDHPVVGRDQLRGYGQADSAPHHRVVIASVETLEYVGQLVGGDARAGVLDLEDGSGAHRFDREANLAPRRRVLDGIGQQVGDDLV